MRYHIVQYCVLIVLKVYLCVPLLDGFRPSSMRTVEDQTFSSGFQFMLKVANASCCVSVTVVQLIRSEGGGSEGPFIICSARSSSFYEVGHQTSVFIIFWKWKFLRVKLRLFVRLMEDQGGDV